MENPGYVTLSRQSGLLAEMRAVANNIANMSTHGFRAENVIFAEMVHDAGDQQGLSMARAHVRHTDFSQGALEKTGGAFDLAISGRGFFQIEGANGPLLTRAGVFVPNEAGELATPSGKRLLDIGGAPVFVPPDGKTVAVAPDGTLSVDGRALAQIGVFSAEDDTTLVRQPDASFATNGPITPVENPVVLQGFVENSNVDPISQVARMIEVQRAYEMGQRFLEREDNRIRDVVKVLGA